MPAWFETFAADVDAGDPRYRSCRDCDHATLPPREVCPACGSTDLDEAPLSDRGTVRSFTEISVTVPKFHGETPYTVVLVGFDEGVSLTGQLRGASAEALSLGDELVLGTEPREDGTPLLTFRPPTE